MTTHACSALVGQGDVASARQALVAVAQDRDLRAPDARAASAAKFVQVWRPHQGQPQPVSRNSDTTFTTGISACLIDKGSRVVAVDNPKMIELK